MSDEDEETEYESVMPFVVCESQGGTLDDDVFTYGFEAGMIYAEMGSCYGLQQTLNVVAIPQARPVHTEIVPQVDLMAMRYGYVLKTEEIENEDEWTWVTFLPAKTELDEENHE